MSLTDDCYPCFFPLLELVCTVSRKAAKSELLDQRRFGSRQMLNPASRSRSPSRKKTI